MRAIPREIISMAERIVFQILHEPGKDKTFLVKSADGKAINSHSVYHYLMQYKNKHDSDMSNHRKTTSDFLANLMRQCREQQNFFGNETMENFHFHDSSAVPAAAAAAMPATMSIDPAEGLNHCFALLLALKMIIQARLNELNVSEGVRQSKKLMTGKFLQALLEPLLNIFVFPKEPQRAAIVQSSLPALSSLRKGKQGGFLAQRYQRILQEIETILVTLRPHVSNICFNERNGDIIDRLLPLFAYCADEEIRRGSHDEKRIKVYETIYYFLLARTNDQFVGVFKSMQQMIETSRRMGHSRRSQRSELLMAEFRDWLVYKLVVEKQIEFNSNELRQIYDSLFVNVGLEGDRKIPHSRYVVDLNFMLENPDIHASNKEAIGYLEALLLRAPQRVNNQTVNIHQEMFLMGPSWQHLITQLLQNGGGLGSEDWLKVAALGFYWNYHIIKHCKQTGQLLQSVDRSYIVNLRDVPAMDLRSHKIVTQMDRGQSLFDRRYFKMQGLWTTAASVVDEAATDDESSAAAEDQGLSAASASP